MEVTSDLVDWFQSHAELTRSRSDKVTGPGRDFVNFLWPAGLNYYSPLSPTFVTEVGGMVAVGGRPMCLVRDGLVPLLWFFREFPQPKSRESWLFVHADLAGYVPGPWRAVAGRYRIRSDRKLFRGAPARKLKRLLLTGVMMDAYCDIPELEEQLDRVCSDLGTAKAGLEEVVAFIPARFDGFGVEHRHEYPIDYVAALSRAFGSKLRGITWTRFESADSWQGYAVCDLNSKFVCADSYMVHRALGRGAVLVGEERAPEAATESGKPAWRWVPLSPFHGMEVSLTLGSKCVFQSGRGLPEEMTPAFERKFMDAMRSEANRRFPWPMWFAHWAEFVAAANGGKSRSRDH